MLHLIITVSWGDYWTKNQEDAFAIVLAPGVFLQPFPVDLVGPYSDENIRKTRLTCL